jgi:hypothetical protein
MPLFKRRAGLPPPDLAKLRLACREFIRQMPPTDPDEVWIPAAIYYGTDGLGLAEFNLDAAEVTQAFEGFLEENSVTAWGFWATTWFVHADDVDAAPGVRPEEHPRRFEALLLRLHAADESAIEIARIERHENAPPTLGMWEILEEGEPLP